ncbi:hypothetical protein LTS10_004498 [Elasticomyces elasticus]|nr:hypothetical protein LTS10_004498 [Elasticomyces elasticus]
MAPEIAAPPLHKYEDGKQYAIHPDLFAPTNHYFYGDKIKTEALDCELPYGWSETLRSILGEQTEVKEDSLKSRLHWFQVNGSNAQISKGPAVGIAAPSSSANWAHHLLVMNTLLPGLHLQYGESLRKHVTIVVPYERQRTVYNVAIARLKASGWSEDELPDVWTITPGEHHDKVWDVVILDLVKSKGSDALGFLQNDDRAAVAFTRAKKACFVISGDLAYLDNNPQYTSNVRRFNLEATTQEQRRRAPTTIQLDSLNAITYYRDYARSHACLSVHDAEPFDIERVPLDIRPKQLTPSETVKLVGGKRDRKLVVASNPSIPVIISPAKAKASVVSPEENERNMSRWDPPNETKDSSNWAYMAFVLYFLLLKDDVKTTSNAGRQVEVPRTKPLWLDLRARARAVTLAPSTY